MTDQHPQPAEITNEMVEAGASYAWEAANPGILGWNSLTENHKKGCCRDARNVLTAALAVDARPWEPLAPGDPLNAGDEVKREWRGSTLLTFVGSVDKHGNPWTAGESYIGNRRIGTWYVRRAAQRELPTTDGAILIPAEGVSLIESVNPWADGTHGVAMHHVLRLVGGLWIGDGPQGGIPAAFITPGTWQEARV